MPWGEGPRQAARVRPHALRGEGIVQLAQEDIRPGLGGREDPIGLRLAGRRSCLCVGAGATWPSCANRADHRPARDTLTPNQAAARWQGSALGHGRHDALAQIDSEGIAGSFTTQPRNR